MKKTNQTIKRTIAAFCTVGILAIPSAHATQSWQDIRTSVPISENARIVCPETLAKWKARNCSSKTCTARWNGQWDKKTEYTFLGKKEYYVCGTHKLERSSWREQPLASRSLTRAEKAANCRYDNKAVSNGWQYDDVCRDKLNMNTGDLNHVTIIDSINDMNTQEIIKGLKGENASKKLPDGRYIFVLRKYANAPDKLGLVLRRYDRNVIQPTGQVCKNDKFSYADNLNKTISKGNPGHVRHSQLNGGWKPVYSAGELWVKNGQIIVVSNESGHFKPTKASLDAVKETLDYLSVPTQNIHFHDFEKDKAALDTVKKQCAGGKIQGWDECL